MPLWQAIEHPIFLSRDKPVQSYPVSINN